MRISLELLSKYEIAISDLFHLLQCCIQHRNLPAGYAVHDLIVQNGLQSNAFLATHLIRMFSQSGCLEDANQVFKCVHEPTVFTWTAAISANANIGRGSQALQLYDQMQRSSVKPDGHVFVAILKVCIDVGDIALGQHIHTHLVEMASESSGCVGNALIDMYAKYGSMPDGSRTFERLKRRDVVTWTSMICGYAQQGYNQEALVFFKNMQADGIEPTAVTYASVLKACSALAALVQGSMIHAQIIENGVEFNVFVASILVDMYFKSGRFNDACKIFWGLEKRDAVMWNTIIAAAVQQARSLDALLLYEKMQDEGVYPDSTTFISIIKAYSAIEAFDQGREVHMQILEDALEKDISVCNALLDFYTHWRGLEDALHIFQNMPVQNVVTWSTIIAGYAQHEQVEEAFQFFLRMQHQGIEPNEITYVNILKACCISASLNSGRLIHGQVIESCFDADACIGGCLVAMYSKFDSFLDATKLFQSLSNRDVVTWGSLLAASAHHSGYELAFDSFHSLKCSGLKPDKEIFVSLIAACTQAGLLQTSLDLLKLMSKEHEITPQSCHYNCMVHLLGRSGHLTEASDLVLALPFDTNAMGWTSLLWHCQTHGNAELGKQCFKSLAAMDSEDRSAICADVWGPTAGTYFKCSGNLEHNFLQNKNQSILV